MAFRAISNNKLRSGITIAVIGLGITALVGILTSIEVMKMAISNSLSSIGANSFQVTSAIIKKKKHGGGSQISMTEGKSISYAEARLFQQRYNFPATVSLSMTGNQVATIVYGGEKTNPNINVTGSDENYLVVNDSKLSIGRNFTATETESGSYVCLLGDGVAKKLFKNKVANALDKDVAIGGIKCHVIGVIASKGSSMFMNSDNNVIIPLNAARQIYGGDNSYTITISVPMVGMKAYASEEAQGIMRVVRKLPLGTDDDFSISQNNDLANMVIENTATIQVAAIFICIITLLNSIIGLMNIMLESVSERTREIGVSKALGARNAYIRGQFLTEAILISLMGGAIGVLVGVLLGNILGLFFSAPFVVPWAWVSLGVALCAIVGILSGIYPAIKASKLDPIVALRYE